MPLGKHHIRYGAVGLVAVALVIGLAIAFIAASAALAAEHALHANLLVLDLVREYVVDHQGAWPRSWTDLEQLPAREGAGLRWPADAEEVRRYVAVDFAAEPDKLATQSVDQFDAIQPIGPCYILDGEMAVFLDGIRQTRQADVRRLPQ
jgi:hypothetical protein